MLLPPLPPVPPNPPLALLDLDTVSPAGAFAIEMDKAEPPGPPVPPNPPVPEAFAAGSLMEQMQGLV